MDVNAFLKAVTSWAETAPDIIGLALVGSHARGEAGPDSDIDLVILTPDPDRLLTGDWPSKLGEVTSSVIESYGAVTSRRVLYALGPEVDFAMAQPSWAEVPLDPGTRSVLASGCRVLHDPTGMLQAAISAAVD